MSVFWRCFRNCRTQKPKPLAMTLYDSNDDVDDEGDECSGTRLVHFWNVLLTKFSYKSSQNISSLCFWAILENTIIKVNTRAATFRKIGPFLTSIWSHWLMTIGRAPRPGRSLLPLCQSHLQETLFRATKTDVGTVWLGVWLDYLFNIWPFTTLKICTKNCRNMHKILPNNI